MQSPALDSALRAEARALAAWLARRTGVPEPVEEAERVLRRATSLHPGDVEGCLTRFDAIRVLTRKWLARQLPAELWRDHERRFEARALAEQIAARLAGNRDTILPPGP